ncbi:hypothetical protein PCASD_16780 [Puccinia coronata f. sp. avenae]|uniref:Uncharacterized protein n=1 Tax=Puccinia coronata f. sp. avenae TaxID=200324 RepID=A0A2N5TVF1_9BASI|nr:hypothetical protein PCASD_16780 [Puccinia coronata f. sp. avenae]
MNHPGYHGTYENPQSFAAPWQQQQTQSTMIWTPSPFTSQGSQSQHNATFSQRVDGMSGDQDPRLLNHPLPPANSQPSHSSHPSSSAINQQHPFNSPGFFNTSHPSSNVNLASSVAPHPYSQKHSLQARCDSQPLPCINLSVISGMAAPPQATGQTQLLPQMGSHQDQSCSNPPTGTEEQPQPALPSNQTSNTSDPTARPAPLPDPPIGRNGHPDKRFLQGAMSGPNPDNSDVDRLLSEAEMKKYQDMSLDELRTIAINSAKRLCMSDNMKEELNKLYYKFQRDLYKLAIKNRVGPHLYFAHIGHSRKARAGGGTSWNNFQHYNPEAKKLFAEFGKDEGGDRVSEMWAAKDADERHAPTNATRVTAANSCASVAKIPQKQVLTTITNWALKTEAKLKSFAFFHQVEGFFVLASRHPKSTIFKKGGLPLGTNFLAIIAEKDDAAGHFHMWVAGKAIQILNGIRIDTANAKEKAPGEAGEIARGCNQGSVAANFSEAYKLIVSGEASGNRLNCAWPGKDCKKKLKEKKLKLCVSKNDWNIQKSNLLQPLEKLHKGPALGVLACIQTKKITLTYGEIDSDSSDKEAPSDLEEETQLDNRSLNSGSGDDNTNKSTDSSPSKKRARQTKNASKKKDNTSTKKDSTSKKKTSERDGSTNRTNTGSTTRANTSNTNPVPGTLNGNSNMSNIAGEASTAPGRGNATEAIPTLDPFLNTLS